MTNSHVLTQFKAKNLGAGKHFDGQGLMLVKQRKDAGKWILRFVIGGKRREMGLGRWPEVFIAEARDLAIDARRQVRSGTDPVEARQLNTHRKKRLTVAEAIEACFEARQAELKGDGKAGRWMSPLSVHVIPKIGARPIEEVDQHVLKKTLEPIWHEKADTARKAMNRLNLTLKHAAALGLDVDLQAVITKRGVTKPLDAERHGYQTSLLRRMDNHFNRPLEEIDAAYARWADSRHYSLMVARKQINEKSMDQRKRTVSTKSGEMRSIGAIMRASHGLN